MWGRQNHRWLRSNRWRDPGEHAHETPKQRDPRPWRLLPVRLIKERALLATRSGGFQTAKERFKKSPFPGFSHSRLTDNRQKLPDPQAWQSFVFRALVSSVCFCCSGGCVEWIRSQFQCGDRTSWTPRRAWWGLGGPAENDFAGRNSLRSEIRNPSKTINVTHRVLKHLHHC